MADAYTTRVGLIKPESGQSLNTWGTKLNDNNFDLTDKALAGFENIAVTGDFSLTRTNGTSTSTQINKGIRLAGTPTAAFTVTHLSYEHIMLVRNNSGRTSTHKVSAGTGVDIPDGGIAYVGYNSAIGDISFLTPNFVGTGYTVSQNGHIASKAYVDTTVAAAAIPGAAGTVKVDAAATAGYLGTVLTASGSIVLTDNGDTLDVGFTFDEGQGALYAGMMGL